jgi:hypothetical protein
MKETTKRWRHLWETPDGEDLRSGEWEPSKKDAETSRTELIARSKATDEDYSDYFDESWPSQIEEREFAVLRPDPSDQAIVVLTEEYGYRYWLWQTGMTDDELVAYWKGLETVEPFFFDPRELPGTLSALWFASRGFTETGEDEEQGVWVVDPDTDENDEEPQMAWLIADAIPWKGHIHQDDDSGLTGPEGIGSILHAGFRKTDFTSGAFEDLREEAD